MKAKAEQREGERTDLVTKPPVNQRGSSEDVPTARL